MDACPGSVVGGIRGSSVGTVVGSAVPLSANGLTKPGEVEEPPAVGRLRPGVGSNATQPTVGKKASTHACALFLLTTYTPGLSISPVANPTATRDGTPLYRSRRAMVPAKCWQ
jgi:hypothetical protein